MLFRGFAGFHGLFIGEDEIVYCGKDYKNQLLDCSKGGAGHEQLPTLFRTSAVYIKLASMEYSAATASVSIGRAVFLLPHFSIGLVCLFFALRGKVIIRGVESKLGLLMQVPFGLLFLGVAAWSVINDTVQTSHCRVAEANGEFESVSGPVNIVKRFAKPGYGYVEFTVGNHALKTYESGLSSDCGYILPLGKSLQLQDGMVVEAKVQGSKVLFLKVKNAS